MFNLIGIAFVAIIGCIGILIPIDSVFYIGIIFFIFAGIWLFASFMNNLTSYSYQLKMFEKLRSKIKKISIYKEKQTELLVQFKEYLGEKYPEFEEKMLKNLTATNAKLVLKNYNIKSSKLILELVDRIDELSSSIYEIKLDIEDDVAEIRYYNNGKWEYIKPNIPEDIKNIIY